LVGEGKGGYQDENVAIDLVRDAAESYLREPRSSARAVLGTGGVQRFSCAFGVGNGKIVAPGLRYT
jgi:hypothetical protein